MKTNDAAGLGIQQDEQLSRQLTSGPLSMIAIGGAIGTGLFLGSSLAVRIAGPGVIVSYLIGPAIALLCMGALFRDGARSSDRPFVRDLGGALSQPLGGREPRTKCPQDRSAATSAVRGLLGRPRRPPIRRHTSAVPRHGLRGVGCLKQLPKPVFQ
jgi:hypothetical protein